MRYLVAVLLQLALLAPLYAGNCFIRARSYAVPQKVVAVKQQQVIVKKEYVPLLVYQPIYTGSYQPPVDQQAESLRKQLEEQRLKILELELRLKYEGRGGQAPGSPLPAREQPSDPFNPPKQPDSSEAGIGLRVLQNRCAQCHDSTRLQPGQELGGGIELLRDGKLLQLTCATHLAVAKAVYTGTMPKRGSGDPLTPEEIGGVMVLMAITKPRD